MRIVICTIGGEEDAGYLPGSLVRDTTLVGGGLRSLYELAFAAAAGGQSVELRGEIAGPVFERMAGALTARPLVNLPPRRATAEDIVIAPEGRANPACLVPFAFSPARCIMLLLAPPGLFGWPFTAEWQVPDPLTIPIDDLARPEHFQAMATLGFELWSNSSGLARAAERAGVRCTCVGVGWPVPPPTPPIAKTTDVVAVGCSRWAPLVRQILPQIHARYEIIGAVDHDEILRRLGAGRILLWPSRVEGWARIQCEARAMGTVPVALASNPFAEGLDEQHGAVTVASLEDMPARVDALIANPAELARLSRQAILSARALVDWSRYVEAVNVALAQPPPSDAGRSARAGLGRAMASQMQALHDDIACFIRPVIDLKTRGVRDARSAAMLNPLLESRPWRALVNIRRRIRPTLPRPPVVLVGPGSLSDPHYAIRQVLESLQGVVHTTPMADGVYDMVLGWHDSSHMLPSGSPFRQRATRRRLAEMVRVASAQNFWNCAPELDISKRLLGKQFAAVFGRELNVDPATFAGPAVEFSDDKDAQDSRLVQCPAPAKPNTIYQRSIQNDAKPWQWRVVIMGGTPVMAIERKINTAFPFEAVGLDAKRVELKQVFCLEELSLLKTFCAKMVFDYGELDVLRDAGGALWVVDANPTPMLSAVGVPDVEERARIITEQAEILRDKLAWPE
jgi:hypothetical protein